MGLKVWLWLDMKDSGSWMVRRQEYEEDDEMMR